MAVTPQLPDFASLNRPARRFIKRHIVEDRTTLSCTEIYRRIAAGTFPKQITLGPKSVVWDEDEIIAWCEARIAESRGDMAHD